MPKQTEPFKFLQVSDVHLDSKLASRKVALPLSKRQERNQEILAALVRALEDASQRGVDAVLIPGDVWDSESVNSRTINRLIEAVGDLGDIPVIIAPGNHDYCSADSLYSPTALSAKGMRRWPANVHIFSTPAFSVFQHPRRDDVAFTGRAFTQNVPVSDRLLSGSVPKSESAAVNILLFHGALDGYKGGDSGWPGKQTAPFSAGELAHLGFTYAAIGHYHDYTEIVSGGRLVGAYSGCLAGRWFEENGPRYALYGTIDGDEQAVHLEKVEYDERRLAAVTCDITEMTSSAVVAELEASLAEAGAREGSDIVHIRLDGYHPTGGEPVYVEEAFRSRYYHVVVEDLTRPEYLTERYDKRTTEGKFIHAMLELKKKAEAAGGSYDDQDHGALTQQVIEDALYYGLDALKQKKVTVRHVD